MESKPKFPTCEDEPLHQPVKGYQLELFAELFVHRPVGPLALRAAVVHILAPGGRVREEEGVGALGCSNTYPGS